MAMTVDLLLNLPRELQASVLSDWLGDCAEICRLEIAYCNKELRPELLRTIGDVFTTPTVATGCDEDILSWMISRNVKAMEIIVQPGRIRDEESVKKMLQHFGPSVTTLTIENVINSSTHHSFHAADAFDIPIYLWEGVANNCPNLRKIDNTLGEVDQNMNIVVRKCLQLEHINFERSRNIPMSVVQACCDLPHLQVLNLTRASMMDTATELVLVEPKPSVRTLLLEGSNVAHTTALQMIRAFPNLLALSMARCDASDLLEIAKLTPNMQKCEFTDLPDVIDRATAAELCTHWKGLQVLNFYCIDPFVSTCSDEVLLIFVQRMPTLRTLRVINTTMTRGYYAPPLPPTPLGAPASKLVDLQAAWVSTATLETVLQCCPHLTALHLVDTSTTDKAPVSLLHNSSVKTIIFERAFLLESDLLAICNMKEVFLVDISGIFSIDGLVGLAKQCPELSTYVVSHAPSHIDHRVVRGILDVCPNLKVFVFTSVEPDQGGTPTHLALEEMIMHFYPNIAHLHLML